MTELVLSIVLMYGVVGSAAYWGLRKRQAQRLVAEAASKEQQ